MDWFKGSNKSTNNLEMEPLQMIYGFVSRHEGENHLIGISTQKKGGKWFLIPDEYTETTANHPELDKKIPNKKDLKTDGQYRTTELPLTTEALRNKYVNEHGEFHFNGEILLEEQETDHSISTVLERSDAAATNRAQSTQILKRPQMGQMTFDLSAIHKPSAPKIYNHGFDRDVSVLISRYGMLKLSGPITADNWLRNLETYATKEYGDCEWLLKVAKLLIHPVFTKWYYTNDKEAKFGTWNEFRSLLKEEHERLDKQFVNLVTEAKTSFLTKIAEYKEDKIGFGEIVKKAPVTTYFKEKINLIECVYPASDDHARIGIALSSCGDSNLQNSLWNYRSCNKKQFLSFCSVEDELQKSNAG